MRAEKKTIESPFVVNPPSNAKKPSEPRNCTYDVDAVDGELKPNKRAKPKKVELLQRMQALESEVKTLREQSMEKEHEIKDLKSVVVKLKKKDVELQSSHDRLQREMKVLQENSILIDSDNGQLLMRLLERERAQGKTVTNEVTANGNGETRKISAREPETNCETSDIFGMQITPDRCEFLGADLANPHTLFVNPHALCVVDGKLVVADQGRERIHVFAPKEGHAVQVASFGINGTQHGQVGDRLGLCNFKGNILVADCSNHRIQEFTLDGSFVRRFGSKGNGLDQLTNPSAVCANSNGIYVIDEGNKRIQHYSLKGKLIRSFATGLPFCSIAICALDDKLAVLDGETNCLQFFSFDGVFLDGVLLPGRFDCLCADNGKVIVGSNALRQLRVISSNGELIKVINDVSNPLDVCVFNGSLANCTLLSVIFLPMY